MAEIHKHFQVGSISELTVKQMNECIKILEKKMLAKVVNEDQKQENLKVKYKVGEIVKHKKFGKGKIIFIENSNDIGVEFEKEDDGLHDCGGKGQEFHCWWCCEEDLKKVVVKKTKNEEYTEQLIDNVITKFTETVKQRDEEFNT